MIITFKPATSMIVGLRTIPLGLPQKLAQGIRSLAVKQGIEMHIASDFKVDVILLFDRPYQGIAALLAERPRTGSSALTPHRWIVVTNGRCFLGERFAISLTR